MKKLVIKSVGDNLQGYNGFQYPKSGPVEAPDFVSIKECGNGLHGLLEGKGDWGYLELNNKTTMLLIEVEEEDIVDLGDKVKFKKGNVIKVGNIAEIVGELVKAGVWKDNNSVIAKSGLNKNVASSDHAFVISCGHGAKATSVTNGYGFAIASGTYSNAISTGYPGSAFSFGLGSVACATNDAGKAAAFGDNACAYVTGLGGRAKAGKNGCITLRYFKYFRYHVVTAYVGKNGIKADTWYSLNADGEFVEN